ncbi:MAG: GNAT family N-acetyltransferase [Candidatus Thermoplasmatota archaeon]
MRTFNRDDLEEVHEIASLSLKEEYPQELYLSIKKTWKEGFLVADISGDVVGFICGIKEEIHRSRILMLAVHPLYRNRGIGSKLLKHYIEMSSRSGFKSVTLEVRVSHTSTIKFYQKRGFQILDRLESFYTNGEDGFKMIRYL